MSEKLKFIKYATHSKLSPRTQHLKNKLIKKVQSLFCEYLCLSEDVYNGENYLHDQKRIPISTLISFMSQKR